MICVPNYKILCALSSKPKEGELAVTDSRECYRYSNGEWVRVEKGGLTLNVYDLNKQLCAQMPDMDNEKLIVANAIIKGWATSNEYYMLYGRDIHYFTLFHINENSNSDIGTEIIECLKAIGPIKSIQKNKDNVIECWVKNNDECIVLYLFPYDEGVIECIR